MTPQEHQERRRLEGIVKANMGLAQAQARRWSEISPVPYEDLLQLACIGLFRAAQGYKPELGAFSSFAVPKIKCEIQHFLRDYPWRNVTKSRRNREKYSKVVRLHRKWIDQNISVDMSKVAASIMITRDRWADIQEEAEWSGIVSLDGVDVAEQAQDEIDLHSAMWESLPSLPNPYRNCLELMLGGLNEEAIAKRKEIPVELAEQYVSEGVARLRKQLERRMA